MLILGMSYPQIDFMCAFSIWIPKNSGGFCDIQKLHFDIFRYSLCNFGKGKWIRTCIAFFDVRIWILDIKNHAISFYSKCLLNIGKSILNVESAGYADNQILFMDIQKYIGIHVKTIFDLLTRYIGIQEYLWLSKDENLFGFTDVQNRLSISKQIFWRLKLFPRSYSIILHLEIELWIL